MKYEEEYIKRYGEAAYKKMQQQHKDWCVRHRGDISFYHRGWRRVNPDKVKALSQEYSRKGGKYYKKM